MTHRYVIYHGTARKRSFSVQMLEYIGQFQCLTWITNTNFTSFQSVTYNITGGVEMTLTINE